MRCAEALLHLRFRAFAACIVALAMSACGGGTSTETTITGGGASGGGGGTVVTLDTPTGPNTTEIVVDSGPPSAFALGVANIPYVSVTVCTPGSATDCVSIDHVFLDTGSYGLRVMKSAVASLTLPTVAIAADAASSTPAGDAVECYPFVLGAIWGPLARADVRIAGELASSLPIQVIDDATPAGIAPTADCLQAANGALLSSVASLEAKGVLGVGMVGFDCGVACITGNYTGVHTQYYSCLTGGTCAPAAIPIASQVQNPVSHFAVNNNGTLIALPALPDLGAGTAKGRLVFGIGTQSNNQIPLSAKMYFVDTNPANDTYLYFTTTVGSTIYRNSYIDSGSNALFFDDTSIPTGCQSSAGSAGGWYCPPSILRRTASITDALGTIGQVDFAIANADALFSTSSNAFGDLGGAFNQGNSTFVWGLPLFYGRTVYTSIWGQALSPNGPWNAF